MAKKQDRVTVNLLESHQSTVERNWDYLVKRVVTLSSYFQSLAYRFVGMMRERNLNGKGISLSFVISFQSMTKLLIECRRDISIIAQVLNFKTKCHRSVHIWFSKELCTGSE